MTNLIGQFSVQHLKQACQVVKTGKTCKIELFYFEIREVKQKWAYLLKQDQTMILRINYPRYEFKILNHINF